MLPFGVTIPATVPQRSEILEGLMIYPARARTHTHTHTMCVMLHVKMFVVSLWLLMIQCSYNCNECENSARFSYLYNIKARPSLQILQLDSRQTKFLFPLTSPDITLPDANLLVLLRHHSLSSHNKRRPAKINPLEVSNLIRECHISEATNL